MENLIVKVEGMSCAHCEKRVVKALMELEGVENAVASAVDKQVTVSGKNLNRQAIAAAIEDAGYSVNS